MKLWHLWQPVAEELRLAAGASGSAADRPTALGRDATHGFFRCPLLGDAQHFGRRRSSSRSSILPREFRLLLFRDNF